MTPSAPTWIGLNWVNSSKYIFLQSLLILGLKKIEIIPISILK